MEIKKVMATVAYQGWHLQKLIDSFAPAQVAVVDHSDSKSIEEALEGVDVAILRGNLDERILACKTLKWVHVDMAGINDSCRQEVFDRGIMLTGSMGRSAPVLVEHTLFFMLSLVYKSREALEAQLNRNWLGWGFYAQDRGLYGKTIGIIGLGYTGKTLAERAKQLGMKVLAFDKFANGTPENVDEMYTEANGDTINPILEKSDFVVLSCRLTDDTYHLIDEKALSAMKKSAFLINIARGPIIDSQALVNALEKGVIAGAASDVFEPEPLPKDSPLWLAPHFIMTPHCTPEMPDMTARCLDIICENIRRFREDKPLLNQVTIADLYSH